MKAFSQVVMMAGLASAQNDGTTLARFLDTSQNVTLISDKSPTASMYWTMEGEVSLRQKTQADSI